MSRNDGARDTLITKDENRSMFDEIARSYDIMNKIISLGLDRGWRRRAVSMLSILSGTRVLDIGCGTADLAVDIAARHRDTTVVGLDPSFGMLRIGRDKVVLHGLGDRVDLAAGDAVSLPFASGTFDGIILGFSVRNVERRRDALSEMVRVLRPNGRLVILELGIPAQKFYSFFYRIHTRTLVPLAAMLFTKKGAYQYLIESVKAFPSPKVFMDEMYRAGFVEVVHTPLSFGAVNLFTAKISVGDDPCSAAPL